MAVYALEQLALWTGGHIRKGEPGLSIPAISTDTRSIRPGEAFLAFRGENFDGHSFVAQAIQAGASLIIIESENNISGDILESAPAVLEVDNTLEAWGDIAHGLRMQFEIPVLGLTGSVGKTSTRGFVANVIRQRYHVLENEKNYNNLIGVPMTLMKLNDRHEWAVLELGTDRPGEIERLTEISSPTMALLTSVCPCHLEAFGNLDMIVEEKGSLLKGLRGDNPLAIVATDCYGIDRLKELAPGQVITYGIEDGDFSATGISVDSDGYAACILTGPGSQISVRLRVLGAHQVKNALAGFVVGSIAGIPFEAIKEGLESYSGAWGRLDRIRLTNGAVILKDVYNANPDSTRAALDVLEAMSGGRKIAVLGDMLELGEKSDEMHRAIGRFAALKKIDLFVTVGERASSVFEEVRKQGIVGESEHFETNEQAAHFIQSVLRDGDVALLKASRSMFFEEIADYLENGVDTFGSKGVGHA